MYTHLKKAILSFAVCLLSLLFTAGSADGDVIVRFPQQELTVQQAFDLIKAQTGYYFSYSNKNLDTARKIRFTRREMPLEEAMDYILADTEFHYNIQNQFVVIPNTPKPAVVQRNEKPAIRHEEKHARVEENITRTPSVMSSPTRVALIQEEGLFPDDDEYYTSNIIPIENYVENRLPRYALKSNLLYGFGTLTPNLGIEFGLGNRTSLELHTAVNPWHLESKGDNKKLAHFYVRPEFRYWFCERLRGHFLGIHAIYARYNIGGYNIPPVFEKEYRYEGDAVGGGLTYGYFLPFSKHWGMEFNVGVGALWLKYDRFRCTACEKSSEPNSQIYFGPTRAGITLVYNIK